MGYILSVDVGVKNLALCVVDRSTKSIRFWRCYDVLEGDRGKPKAAKREGTGKCQGILRGKRGKSGKACERMGTVNTSTGRAYCGIHDPSRRHTPKETQGWCWGMLRTLPVIQSEIQKMMNDVSGDIKEIVIEQQSMKSKRMLMMGHILYGHFVHVYNNEVKVRFVPAWGKLKVYDGPEIECKLKTQYARNKYLARKHTEHILGNGTGSDRRWLAEVFNKSKKQDDLADSYLQAVYYSGAGRTRGSLA